MVLETFCRIIQAQIRQKPGRWRGAAYENSSDSQFAEKNLGAYRGDPPGAGGHPGAWAGAVYDHPSSFLPELPSESGAYAAVASFPHPSRLRVLHGLPLEPRRAHPAKILRQRRVDEPKLPAAATRRSRTASRRTSRTCGSCIYPTSFTPTKNPVHRLPPEHRTRPAQPSDQPAHDGDVLPLPPGPPADPGVR